MGRERWSVEGESGTSGREEVAVDDVVVDEADPGVEEQVRRHGLEARFARGGGGEVGGDGGLDAGPGGAEGPAKRRSFEQEVAVESFVAGEHGEVGVQGAAESGLGADLGVEAVRQGGGEGAKDFSEEVLAGGEVDEDGAVGESGGAGDVEGADGGDAAADAEAEGVAERVRVASFRRLRCVITQ